MAAFKWTVEFTVDEVWVADGFDLTLGRAREMIANDLRFALNEEISARILKAPDPERIRKAQGAR
jgi:hypothetical protein